MPFPALLLGASGFEWLLTVLGLARFARLAGTALALSRKYIAETLLQGAKAYAKVRNTRTYRVLSGAGAVYMFVEAFAHIYQASGISHKFDEVKMLAYENLERPLLQWAGDVVGGVPLRGASREDVKDWVGRIVGGNISAATGWKISTVYPVDVLKNEVAAMTVGGLVNNGAVSDFMPMSASDLASYRNQIMLAYNKERQHSAERNAQKRAWRQLHPEVTLNITHSNFLIRAVYIKAMNDILARWREIEAQRAAQQGNSGGGA